MFATVHEIFMNTCMEPRSSDIGSPCLCKMEQFSLYLISDHNAQYDMRDGRHILKSQRIKMWSLRYSRSENDTYMTIKLVGFCNFSPIDLIFESDINNFLR